MARMRTIKPELLRSLTLASVSADVRWTLGGLLTYVDDSGRAVDEPRLVKAELYALDDDMTAQLVDEHLAAIAAIDDGPLCRYQHAGRRYLHIIDFDGDREWSQRINRPTRSRIPACPHHEAQHDQPSPPQGALTEHSLSDQDADTEGSTPRARPRNKGTREQGSGGTRARAGTPPHAPPSTTTPRPPRCAAHARLPDHDPGPPCRACAHIRLNAETAAAQAEQAAAQQRATDHARTRAAIADCDRCDLLGFRELENGNVARCDHTPDQRAAALVG